MPPKREIQPPQESKPLDSIPNEMRQSHNERNFQDLEYEQILLEAQREEEEKKRKEEEEARKLHEEQKEQESKENKLRKILQNMPEEPQTGITIAVVLFNKRVMRRFLPSQPGIDVYAWITKESDGQLDLDEFEMAPLGGEKLDKHQTLEEQNIKGRVMLNITNL